MFRAHSVRPRSCVPTSSAGYQGDSFLSVEDEVVTRTKEKSQKTYSRYSEKISKRRVVFCRGSFYAFRS